MKVEVEIYSSRFESFLKFTAGVKDEKDLTELFNILKRVLTIEEDLAHLQPAKKK